MSLSLRLEKIFREVVTAYQCSANLSVQNVVTTLGRAVRVLE
jgi:hypothetical protein